MDMMKDLVLISLIVSTVVVAQGPEGSFLSAISFEPHTQGRFVGVSDEGRDDTRSPGIHNDPRINPGYRSQIRHGPPHQFHPRIVDHRHEPRHVPYRSNNFERVPVRQDHFVPERRRLPTRELGRSPGQPLYRPQIQPSPSRHHNRFLPNEHRNRDLLPHFQKQSSITDDFDVLLSPLPGVGELGPSFGKQKSHPVNVDHEIPHPSRNQEYEPSYSNHKRSEFPSANARYRQQEGNDQASSRYPQQHEQDQSLRPSIPFPTDNHSSRQNPPVPSIPNFGVPLAPPTPIQPVHHQRPVLDRSNSNFPQQHQGYPRTHNPRIQPVQEDIHPVHDFSERHAPENIHPINDFSERRTQQAIHPPNDFSERSAAQAIHPAHDFRGRQAPRSVHPVHDFFEELAPNNQFGPQKQGPEHISEQYNPHSVGESHFKSEPTSERRHQPEHNSEQYNPHSVDESRFRSEPTSERRHQPEHISEQYNPHSVDEHRFQTEPTSERRHQPEYSQPQTQEPSQREYAPPVPDFERRHSNTEHNPISNQQQIGLTRGHLLSSGASDQAHAQPPFVASEHQAIHHEPNNLGQARKPNGNEVQYNTHPEEHETHNEQYPRPFNTDQTSRDQVLVNKETNTPIQTPLYADNSEPVEPLVYTENDNSQSHPNTGHKTNAVPRGNIPTKTIQLEQVQYEPTKNSKSNPEHQEPTRDTFVGNLQKGTLLDQPPISDLQPRTAAVLKGPGVVIVKPNLSGSSVRARPLTKTEVTRQLAPSSALIPPGLRGQCFQYKDLSAGYSLSDESFGYPDKAVSGEFNTRPFLAPILGYKNFVEARSQFDLFSVGPFSGSKPNINDYLARENVYPTGYKQGDFKMATPRDRSCRVGKRTLRMFNLFGGKCWVVNPDYQMVTYNQCSAPGGSCSTCSTGPGGSGRCSEDYSWVTVWAYCEKSGPGQGIRHIRIYLPTGCSCKTYYC